jgi:two-component system, LytTR family, sensor kinase
MIRRIARDYAASIAVWMTLSVPVSWQEFKMAQMLHLGGNFHDEMLVFGARYLSVALLTPLIFYLVGRWPITGSTAVLRTAAYLAGYIPFCVAFAFIRWCLVPPWIDETQEWGPRSLFTLNELVVHSFADVFLIYLGIIIAAYAYTYYVRNQRQEIERLELSQALAQSELQALKFQLHPHFLFNTLQGISTLVDTDKGAAQTMIVKLSTLLRVALKHGSADLIPLSEEVAFARSYLELQKMRLGKRLDVQWHMAPETMSTLVPQLILQPLIENAIVHGIACCREGGWIDVRSQQVDSVVTIEVRNSVGGHSEHGIGLGLQNTGARLKYLYSSEASFSMNIGPDRIATATLHLPSLGANPSKEARMAAEDNTKQREEKQCAY